MTFKVSLAALSFAAPGMRMFTIFFCSRSAHQSKPFLLRQEKLVDVDSVRYPEIVAKNNQKSDCHAPNYVKDHWGSSSELWKMKQPHCLLSAFYSFTVLFAGFSKKDFNVISWGTSSASRVPWKPLLSPSIELCSQQLFQVPNIYCNVSLNQPFS